MASTAALGIVVTPPQAHPAHQQALPPNLSTSAPSLQMCRAFLASTARSVSDLPTLFQEPLPSMQRSSFVKEYQACTPHPDTSQFSVSVVRASLRLCLRPPCILQHSITTAHIVAGPLTPALSPGAAYFSTPTYASATNTDNHRPQTWPPQMPLQRLPRQPPCLYALPPFCPPRPKCFLVWAWATWSAASRTSATTLPR